MSDAESPDPSKPSADYVAQAPYWKMVSDILAGVEAMRATTPGGQIGGNPIAFLNQTTQEFARAQGIEAQSPYLPRFPNEPWAEYDRRRKNAFLTNVYSDASANLASKPFAKVCSLAEEAPDDLKKLAENIDGLGNNLHVFARAAFEAALDKGITWIMCDYTRVPSGTTLAAEREMGARAYWVHVKVESLLAVHSKFVNGKEVIFHARIDESCTELDGYEEKTYKRVRELNRAPIYLDGELTGFDPATWVLRQENRSKDSTTGKETVTWEAIADGDITIGIIPLVPIVLGKREGTSWRIAPPLRNLAHMQVKLFQMESNIDAIKELCAFPMLTGNGIKGTDDAGAAIKVPVGPRGVLFAPPGGDGSSGTWAYIEPQGSSLTFLETSLEKHKTEMRDLGMQPLTAANLTVVTTANLSLKATSACQAWALTTKDALEQAWKVTMMWLKKDIEPQVIIHTDFVVKLDSSSDLTAISAAEKDGVISKKLRFSEMKRRGTLADDADWAKDQEEIAGQLDNEMLTPEKMIDPVTGQPLVVRPVPGVPNPPPKPPVKLRDGERLVN